MTKTLSVGHPVTYRRTVTTPFSKLMGDGCILKLVDKTSWVIPKNATQGDKAVYGILGTVNGLPVRGVAMVRKRKGFVLLFLRFRDLTANLSNLTDERSFD